mmetsp:Transcript_52208/g.158606  ORF Transcript_52208/g.158606 Transcript_52208/m.158606 type:complete len:205 (+) Transcript_52208:2885-3499(+)
MARCRPPSYSRRTRREASSFSTRSMGCTTRWTCWSRGSSLERRRSADRLSWRHLERTALASSMWTQAASSRLTSRTRSLSTTLGTPGPCPWGAGSSSRRSRRAMWAFSRSPAKASRLWTSATGFPERKSSMAVSCWMATLSSRPAARKSWAFSMSSRAPSPRRRSRTMWLAQTSSRALASSARTSSFRQSLQASWACTRSRRTT